MSGSVSNLGGVPGVFLMTNSFETGGSERQFAMLAKSLDPSQFQVHLGCIANRGAFNSGLGEIAEFPLGGSLYSLRSIQARRRLAGHLRDLNIGIAHAFDFYTNLTLIPAARLARIPVVIGSQRQIGDLLSPARERIQRMALKWCDRVVCNSRAAADRLIRRGFPESKIVIIRNGIPPSAFAACPPALPVHPSILRVGMIARMNTAAKNHKLFLRAAARLCSFPNLEIVLAGDGPLRAELERETQHLGIAGRVRFLGDRQDIAAILASLDVSVLPSASESLSNTIIESMAAGVPVVAAHAGGNPELISSERGILVPPDREGELADAIERLLLDSALRTSLGRNAREFAQQHFTIAEMQRRHQELYAELLASKAKSRRWRRPVSAGNDRLRVAIIAASPRYVGGQSVQADLLIKNWQDDPAINARFIAIDPDLPVGLRWAQRVPFLRTLIRQPIYLGSLWRGLKHVDIAHIFSASYWSFLLAPAPAWLMSRLRGAKVIIHYHSGEARDHLKRFSSARFVLKCTDRLAVPSDYLRDVFREFDLEAQPIANIVDLSQFHFRRRGRLRPHLVCTRGFHPYYRVDLVVRAFAEVAKQYPDARLDLVGGGPLERQIRNLVNDLGLTHVHFLGVASHKEIARYYDQADIFLNASEVDNMPVSILEAFASGTPVISTAPEGIKYLVEHEHTGLLSEPGNALRLGRNVIRMLQDRELQARIIENAYYKCNSYRWVEVRKQWLELYRSVARCPSDAKDQPLSFPQTNLEGLR